MPNRIIKESLLTSDKISALSDFEFRLWVGLMLIVDDAGRGDARPAIIKGLVFPLRERVSLKDIDAAVHGLAAKGCISLYDVDGKSYFWFPTWGKHQRIRNVRLKYPAPEDGTPVCGNSPQLAADCRDLRPEYEIEIEIESESEEETDARACARESSSVVVEKFEKLSGKRLNRKNTEELEAFVAQMGPECCLRALDVAQDAGKLTWGYVRGILRNKLEQGVTSLEDWDRTEGRRSTARGPVGKREDYQPSLERIHKNQEWLDAFLEGQQDGT